VVGLADWTLFAAYGTGTVTPGREMLDFDGNFSLDAADVTAFWSRASVRRGDLDGDGRLALRTSPCCSPRGVRVGPPQILISMAPLALRTWRCCFSRGLPEPAARPSWLACPISPSLALACLSSHA
jgi:hypothetical protein